MSHFRYKDTVRQNAAEKLDLVSKLSEVEAK